MLATKLDWHGFEATATAAEKKVVGLWRAMRRPRTVARRRAFHLSWHLLPSTKIMAVTEVLKFYFGDDASK